MQPRTYTTVGRNVGMSLPVVQVDYALPCRQTERERERERERSNGHRRPVYSTRIEHLELKSDAAGVVHFPHR